MTDRIRLTISVTPEVHEVFGQIAAMAGVSLSRSMGDWLADTLEGAQFVALKMMEAKQAPSDVLRELHGLGNELEAERARDVATMLGQEAPRPTRSPRSGGRVGGGAPRPVTRGESPSADQVLTYVRRGGKLG